MASSVYMNVTKSAPVSAYLLEEVTPIARPPMNVVGPAGPAGSGAIAHLPFSLGLLASSPLAIQLPATTIAVPAARASEPSTVEVGAPCSR
ncbi:hypothetical protein Nocox_26750 [Nonomuraea coxensis DSM 45129]|uniref:Uncharacterized protein n=1 Tax=Nonomuraea coxensis DSM 45129 TaxID=1122611 RepID=A0ABX8U5J3_9ACTN|nr:hypothetical protein Nocox_26750 [Nonomuraea coxensis DSM 45129]